MLVSENNEAREVISAWAPLPQKKIIQQVLDDPAGSVLERPTQKRTQPEG
jgi:hypothetical protein